MSELLQVVRTRDENRGNFEVPEWIEIWDDAYVRCTFHRDSKKVVREIMKQEDKGLAHHE